MARSHMNMPIICARSFCGVNEVPDFTNCKRVPGSAYNGANGKKIAIEYQGEQYMLKFPPSAQGKRTELSYTNSCISEHIASTIFNMVGIPAQETILGTYDVGGKTKIVCACKDFTADGSKLFDFCSIKNMKALCYRFETTSRRAEYLDRKIERTYRQLSRLLDEPERKLLLKMADLEDALREEACLNSFISGYRLAQGIQQELLADQPPYNFENEDEQRACELAGKER